MVIVNKCPECDKEIMKRNLLSQMKEVHKLTNYNTAKAEVLVYAFKCERHFMQKHSEVGVSFPCAL